LADLIAPNAWELERLSGRDVTDPTTALAAARSMGRPTLGSSIAAGGEIGVLYAAAGEAWLATHQRLPTDPKGAGDLLTALFLGHSLGGAAPQAALRAAVSEVAAVAADRHVPVRVTSL
jgi:pyridoxine kinase